MRRVETSSDKTNVLFVNELVRDIHEHFSLGSDSNDRW